MSTVKADPVMPWTEPFSALYWRIRVQTYVLVAAFALIATMAYWLHNLATTASSLVYVVTPDGAASFIGDREANRQPTEAEVRYTARHFIELMYGFNSSMVHQDIAKAVTMCAPALAKQLREEFASTQFVETIRRRNIRSEVHFDSIEVLEHERRHAEVRLHGSVSVFPITDYDGESAEVRPFHVTLVMAVVPRDPELRLNGLEIVRVVQDKAPITEAK